MKLTTHSGPEGGDFNTMKSSGLSTPQWEVLQWVADGCPVGTKHDKPSAKNTAQALANRGLVSARYSDPTALEYFRCTPKFLARVCMKLSENMASKGEYEPTHQDVIPAASVTTAPSLFTGSSARQCDQLNCRDSVTTICRP